MMFLPQSSIDMFSCTNFKVEEDVEKFCPSFMLIFFLPAWSAATLKRATPINVIVGAIDIGPIKRRRKPMRPVKPINISNNADTIKAPWILRRRKTQVSCR